MAGLSIEVKVTGDLRRFEDRLHRLATADFTSLSRAIGEAVRNDTLDAFQSGESPWGQKWKPSLRAQGQVKGKKAGKTLVDTARLRNSITVRATADAAEVGTNVVYARIHQLGGETGRGRKTQLPARPYLPADAHGLAPKTHDLVQRIVEGWIEEKAK